MQLFARSLIVSASLLALASAPAAAAGQYNPVPRPVAPAATAHDRLFQLFKESDEASLERNPVQALFRGDLRFADRLGEFYSDAHFKAERRAAEHDLSELHAIPRGELSEAD
ncbi:MAG TPA: DUF885 domain-containing protein, partial [Sphingomicrobium sp.]|nr:DUF885 domain-containing protein [Sphingomicrobium sp.]